MESADSSKATINPGERGPDVYLTTIGWVALKLVEFTIFRPYIIELVTRSDCIKS